MKLTDSYKGQIRYENSKNLYEPLAVIAAKILNTTLDKIIIFDKTNWDDPRKIAFIKALSELTDRSLYHLIAIYTAYTHGNCEKLDRTTLYKYSIHYEHVLDYNEDVQLKVKMILAAITTAVEDKKIKYKGIFKG